MRKAWGKTRCVTGQRGCYTGGRGRVSGWRVALPLSSLLDLQVKWRQLAKHLCVTILSGANKSLPAYRLGVFTLTRGIWVLYAEKRK